MYTRVHTCEGWEDAPVGNDVVEVALVGVVVVALDDVAELDPVFDDPDGRFVGVDESSEPDGPPVLVDDNPEMFVAVDAVADEFPVVDATEEIFPVIDDIVRKLDVVNDSVG